MRPFVTLLLFAYAADLQAQSGDTSARGPQDMLQRARQLAEAGKPDSARKLLDSVLKVTSPDSARYADALYWRAAYATTAVDAERDYRRLLIEAPLSVRAEDGMLQLAQLEQARGDRKAASEHLQRFMLTYPNNPARPRVAISLVRLLFDQGQVARGCEVLKVGREIVPEGNAELRNQLEFYSPRCVTLEAPPAPADGATPSTTAKEAPDTVRRTPPPPRRVTAPPSTATSASAFYSVQVAAYDSPEPAQRMARMLVTRGLKARVDGASRPYRVRVGKYTTRPEAVKAAATLKSQGIGGFVALVK